MLGGEASSVLSKQPRTVTSRPSRWIVAKPIPDRAARIRGPRRSVAAGDRFRVGRPDHGPRGDRQRPLRNPTLGSGLSEIPLKVRPITLPAHH